MTQMAKIVILGVLLVMSATVPPFATGAEKYPVSSLVSEVKLQRAGQVLFRYVEFDAESEYPCLRLETLKPGYAHEIIDRTDVCSLLVGNATVDVSKDVSGVYFSNYSVRNGKFRFTAEISLARAGSHYLDCEVMIPDNGKLTAPACKESTRPPEAGDAK